ncbi:hypothetical protein CAEBREN_13293 [Caenorhabditis brenneri]|uniref:F-box domain-containing protein n=1 Tax=Caenorhabditis brenneri TaxID=135651 RepID=G0N6X9_CAEBE|nr:hypothetical protein CAEBREN_13293 [Caenorhabditis brenneri]
MNSIPFLRFPLIVIKEVLSTMTPFELIHLSMVSKRSQTIVKTFSKPKLRNKFNLEFRFVNNYELSVENERMKCEFIFTSSGYNEFSVIYTDRKRFDTIQKRTENKFDEFKKICIIVLDIFESNRKMLHYDINADTNENRVIIDMLKSKSFESCHIYDDKGNDHDLKYLLDNLEFSKKFAIFSIRRDYVPTDLPKNVRSLSLGNARFLKLEQLMRLECTRIWLGLTNLTNNDINVFLKSWMSSESNLNLEQLEIGLLSSTTDDILLNIPNEFRDETRLLPSGVDIKRNDGMTARIQFIGGHTMRMHVHSPVSTELS